MTDIFSAPHFTNDTEARKMLERILWPNGPVCPHCGVVGHSYATKREGVYRCAETKCRKDFSVTTKTVMERSHIPLHKWLQGFHLMTSSKKGVSAHQLHRMLAVTYKTAWFMAHRIREAMRAGGLTPMGGSGKVIEADETYIGRLEGQRPDKRKHPTQYRNTILTLVERGGTARSFHVESASIANLQPIIRANLSREASLHTDEWVSYRAIGKEFAAHETVNHKAEEYVRGEVTTNAVEGYFSIFKRGMKGIYQHCGEKHLHRYLSEYDFRYSDRVKLGFDDKARTVAAIKGAEGKRLTYRQPRSEEIH
ncbi:MAG: IS1595 family transposase [Hyphomicrobiales bacterium]|nr:IS1595 family transposase [Hyphomicrobiales bacterium]